MTNTQGYSDRRLSAERVAFAVLVDAGDPVAMAIRDAVKAATRVEITPALVESFAHMLGTYDTPDGMSTTEFTLRLALQAAGLKVTG
jgi:hypothetical protein